MLEINQQYIKLELPQMVRMNIVLMEHVQKHVEAEFKQEQTHVR
jgi:hypothetical protein